MIEIGLTGGIGSGKSTVADMLVERGAVLIDADRIVRDLQEPGAPVFEAMVERWGSAVVAEDGTLDRAAVAAIVFTDDNELKAINDIVHPAVGEAMQARRDDLKETDAIVVFDIPLLVKSEDDPVDERYSHLQGIIVVDTDVELAVERLVSHRGFDADDARSRIILQASREARRAVADIIIDNSGDLDSLGPQVDAAWVWAESLGSR
ncbi:MAG: dephospho-CoA kinase [Acidimicrobiaceae bacterium]|nr:dephospho-CoA kinase [Acidimicrobiaceae bacterium]MDG1411738.1 dephospho-CoA kinase [Acidimicrobiales bacterium]MDG2216570.1 dephospho-CoA kinase [Acidimicrobiales bacterium]